MKRWYKRLRRHKAKLSSVQIIALGFFIMILVGAGLLMLPWATQIPGGASFGDALFTATSASCVTGLVLQDTGTYWSTFGQVVIICLIQIGGLGFMTIATLFLLLLRRRLGLREREVMVSSVSYGRLGGLSAFVRQIFLGTLLAEGVGAALLSMRFVQDFGWGRGIYYGVWHAVSAFCNGGFDLMGPHSGPFSSFTAYAGDPLVSLTLCALILVGGAGFLVWDDLLRCRHHWRRYRLQTKVVLFVNLVLVAGGAVLFLLLERENLGAGKSLGRQALEAVFDAVTPRTAGFNTTDTASLSAGSTLLTIILMVVGGGPGSTAGGVKVTTVAVLFVHTVAGIRREQSANAFGRSIGDSALKQATSACRLQQVHDGCFPSLEQVPSQALTLTIPAILRASAIVCVVPARTKALAVRTALREEITPHCPASALRLHKHAVLYIETESASLLEKEA